MNEFPGTPFSRTSRRVLAALVGLAVALSLASINTMWFPTSDGAYYLSIGRNIATGHGFKFQGQSVAKTEPGLPLLLAGLYRLAPGKYWPANLLWTLLGLTVGLGAWLIARDSRAWTPEADEPEDRRLAAVVPPVCFVVVLLGAKLYQESTRILTDVPFSALLVIGLWMMGRAVSARRAAGALAWALPAWGLLCAASLTRLIGVVVLAATTISLLCPGLRSGRAKASRGRRAAILAPLAAPVLAVGAWLALAARAGGRATGSFWRLGDVPADIGQYLWRLPRSLVELPGALLEVIWGQHLSAAGAVVTALAVVGAVRIWRRRQWLLLLPAAIYLGALCLIGFAALNTRYVMPATPWLVLWIVTGTAVTARTAYVRWGSLLWHPRRPIETAVWGMALLLAAPAVALDLRHLVSYAHDPRMASRVEHGKWSGYLAASQWIKEHTPPDAMIFTDEQRIVHYMSGRPARNVAVDGADTFEGKPIQWPGEARAVDARYVLVVAGQGAAQELIDAFEADGGYDLLFRSLPSPGSPPGGRANRGGFFIFVPRAPAPAPQ